MAIPGAGGIALAGFFLRRYHPAKPRDLAHGFRAEAG